MNAATAADSMFAAYCKPLYEEYGLLFLDGSFGSGAFDKAKMEKTLQEESAYNLGHIEGIPGENAGRYYRLGVQQVELGQYELATDQEGKVFRHAVLRAMQDGVLPGIVDEVCGMIEYAVAKKGMEEQGDPQQRMQNGDENLEDAQRQQREEQEENSTQVEQPSASTETPQEREEAEKKYRESLAEATQVLGDIASGGELGLFTKGKNLSATKMDISDALEKRSKNQGNMAGIYESGMVPKVCFNVYLQNKFSSYVESKNEHDTKYELEYIVAGKDSDKENLRSVIHRLFLLREGSNFIYRQQDPVTQERATAIAAALCACFPAINPVIIKEAIITAQSVGDSVNDVKDLLAGKRVALYKGGVSGSRSAVQHGAGGRSISKSTKGVDLSKDSVDLKKPDTSIDETKPGATKSWEAGLCYMDYMQIFLFMENETKVTMRSMDLIEWSIRPKPGYASFRMDCLVARAKGSITSEAPLVFSIFGTPNGERGWNIKSDFSVSYEKESKK